MHLGVVEVEDDCSGLFIGEKCQKGEGETVGGMVL